VPATFELTFQTERIHDFEHLCFFLTSLAFWWVVLSPSPSRWMVIPYLLAPTA
jgi:putative membrane protein